MMIGQTDSGVTSNVSQRVSPSFLGASINSRLPNAQRAVGNGACAQHAARRSPAGEHAAGARRRGARLSGGTPTPRRAASRIANACRRNALVLPMAVAGVRAVLAWRCAPAALLRAAASAAAPKALRCWPSSSLLCASICPSKTVGAASLLRTHAAAAAPPRSRSLCCVAAADVPDAAAVEAAPPSLAPISPDLLKCKRPQEFIQYALRHGATLKPGKGGHMLVPTGGRTHRGEAQRLVGFSTQADDSRVRCDGHCAR
jgi:hypothetical protein